MQTTRSGQDASEKFHKFHAPAVLKKWGPELKVGTVSDDQSVEEVVEASEELGEEDETYFGDLVPFGDPYWFVSSLLSNLLSFAEICIGVQVPGLGVTVRLAFFRPDQFRSLLAQLLQRLAPKGPVRHPQIH